MEDLIYDTILLIYHSISFLSRSTDDGMPQMWHYYWKTSFLLLHINFDHSCMPIEVKKLLQHRLFLIEEIDYTSSPSCRHHVPPNPFLLRHVEGNVASSKIRIYASFYI
jgi:hypothetical protein